jgi:hypothetical protein
MNKLIYCLGKRSKYVRKIYYTLTNKWLWGIVGFVIDYATIEKKDIPAYTQDEFDNTIEQIFNYKK